MVTAPRMQSPDDPRASHPKEPDRSSNRAANSSPETVRTTWEPMANVHRAANPKHTGGHAIDHPSGQSITRIGTT